MYGSTVAKDGTAAQVVGEKAPAGASWKDRTGDRGPGVVSFAAVPAGGAAGRQFRAGSPFPFQAASASDTLWASWERVQGFSRKKESAPGGSVSETSVAV